MTKPTITYAGPFAVIKHHSGALHVEVAPEGVEQFQQIFQRALNCWPDALPHTKELGDIVRHGKVLQNYHVQR